MFGRKAKSEPPDPELSCSFCNKSRLNVSALSAERAALAAEAAAHPDGA